MYKSLSYAQKKYTTSVMYFIDREGERSRYCVCMTHVALAQIMQETYQCQHARV